MDALRAENAALVEAVESLRRENMELEKTRHRLQLEVDIFPGVEVHPGIDALSC